MAIDPRILLQRTTPDASGIANQIVGLGQQRRQTQATNKKERQAQEAEELLRFEGIKDDPAAFAQAIRGSSLDPEDQAQLIESISIPGAVDANFSKAKRMLGIKTQEGAGGKLGTVSPKDFTVDSLAAYQQTGNVQDLVRFKPQIKDFSGIPHEFNPTLNKWVPLVDMSSPELEDQVVAEANLAAIKQSKLDFTKQQSKFQGSESQLLSRIDSARSKQTVMDDTINQIKGLANKWNTEFGSSLSSLPGSEARKLKGMLTTVKANSAFGTLADIKATGGTLGAISAPELELLSSALGAVDQGGDVAELVRVLDQISATNKGSVSRLENAFKMDKRKFGSSFKEASRIGAIQSKTAPELTDSELLEALKDAQ